MPGVVNAAGTLLNIRSQKLQANALINSLVLKDGCTNKMCFNRLKSLHLCLSYSAIQEKLCHIGKDFKKPVQKWSENLQNDMGYMKNQLELIFDEKFEIPLFRDNLLCGEVFDSELNETFFEEKAKQQLYRELEYEELNETFTELNISGCTDIDNFNENLRTPGIDYVDNVEDYFLKNMQDSEEKVLHQQSLASECNFKDVNYLVTFDDKFMVVGDNLDLITKRRHMTIDKSNIDYHLFHSIAVKNRIETPPDLIGIPQNEINVKDINLEEILPNKVDEAHLKEEITILVARDLVRYVEDLVWMKKYVNYHIKHEYSDKTSQISDIVSSDVTSLAVIAKFSSIENFHKF